MSRVPLGSSLIGQGISAELIAARWGIERAELDEYSARSGGGMANATIIERL